MYQKIENIFNNKTVKILAIIVVIIAYYYYSFGNYDLDSSDEDVYFASGLNFKLPFQHFGNMLYPMNIYLLSKIMDNNLNILYTHFFLLSSTMFVLMTLFLGKYSKSFWIGFIIATCFLFSSFQVNLLPRITILNLIYGLAALVIIDIKRPAYQNWGILALALLLCNYVSRPEFFYFFCLAFIIFAYLTITEKRLIPSQKFIVLGSFIVFFSLLYLVGGGVKESGKLKFAFTQHFFDNYELWYGKKFDYFDELIQFDKIYGPVKSDLDLITVNPAFFFKHVFTNFHTYFFVVLKMLKSTFYDNYIRLFGFKTVYFVLVFLVSLLFFIDFKKSYANLKTAIKVYLPASVYLVVFLLATLIAVFIIYPREHYVVIQSAFYLLVIAFLVKNVSFKNQTAGQIIKTILPIIIIGTIINLFPYPKNDVSNVGFYKYMHSVSVGKNLIFLNGDRYGYNYFGSKNLKSVEWNTKSNLVNLINSGKYDGITMFRLNLEVPENREFVNNGYKKTNWVRIDRFEPIHRYIWVKPELAPWFKAHLK